jgi:uncharacterized membrane protein
MNIVNEVLLFLHFLGLALGFSVSFGNMVMGSIISRATPHEKTVLSRFPPTMSQLGRIGLALLWSTGVILVYTRWNGFAAFPWQFYIKLAAVVLLTVTTEYIHRLERLVQKGDAAARSCRAIRSTLGNRRR